MKPQRLRAALALSVLINLGVLAAVGWRMLDANDSGFAAPAGGSASALIRHLELSEEQSRRWRAQEGGFLERLEAGNAQIRALRSELVDAIFAPTPDAAAIEAARARIAALQEDQQRLVIGQLLRERDLLDARQRARLAGLLRAQAAAGADVEQLHRE